MQGQDTIYTSSNLAHIPFYTAGLHIANYVPQYPAVLGHLINQGNGYRTAEIFPIFVKRVRFYSTLGVISNIANVVDTRGEFELAFGWTEPINMTFTREFSIHGPYIGKLSDWVDVNHTFGAALTGSYTGKPSDFALVPAVQIVNSDTLEIEIRALDDYGTGREAGIGIEAEYVGNLA